MTVNHARYEVLTSTESLRGEMPGVLGGDLAHTTANSVHGSGKLAVKDAPGMAVDWLNDRIRITIMMHGQEHPAGVWIPSRPVARYTRAGVEWDVSLFDKLTLLDTTGPGAAYSVPAGTVITQAVQDIIESVGESAGAITHTDAALSSAMTWKPNTSWLRIINDMLEGQFFSLWCDGRGQYQVTPATNATNRPVRHEFIDGQNCLYLPEFDREQDLWRIPNRVVVTSSETGDDPGFVAVAENQNPDSRFSIPSRNGRVIDHVEDGVELDSQDAADAYAARRLVELSSASAKVEITHEFVPEQEINDAVRFARLGVPSAYQIDAKHVVQRREIDLTSAAFLTTTTLREVANV